MKYMPDDIFLIEKKGEDNLVGCLCSVKFMEDQGVKNTAKVCDREDSETLSSKLEVNLSAECQISTQFIWEIY